MPAAYASADKRSELIRAATLLLHEQGFQRTTLADVAGAADVPLGNVYYYFKSKEALAEAVIASHQAALRERFASWAAAHRDPRMRLRCLVRAPLDSEFMQNMAKHAPPEVVTTLAAEIRKLAESGIANRTIAVGARAPDFSLPDARGGKVSLSTLVQTGPTVVTFYRGGWCPFCDLQLRA